MSKSKINLVPGDLICSERDLECCGCPHVNAHQPIFLRTYFGPSVPCTTPTHCTDRTHLVPCIPAAEYFTENPAAQYYKRL